MTKMRAAMTNKILTTRRIQLLIDCPKDHKENTPLAFPPKAIFNLQYDKISKNFKFSLFKSE